MSDKAAAVPTGLGIAGCHAYPADGPRGQPASCRDPVAWTGLVLRHRGRSAEAWQVFACAGHADELIARRRLLPRDWERLSQWREQAERRRPGHVRRPTTVDPYQRPQPVAEGEAAYAMIDRAREWARDHDLG